jgi:signal transduction histidine kinase
MPSDPRTLTRALAMLAEASRVLAQQTDTPSLGRVLAEWAMRLVAAGRVCVYLAVDDRLQLVASRVVPGWSDSANTPHADTVAADADAHELVIRVQRSQQAQRTTGQTTIGRLAVPVGDHHRRVVAVVLAERAPGQPAFEAADEQLLQTLAHTAAVGLDRAKLYERLIEWNRSMEMLLGLNAALSQHLAPGELMRHLVEHATRALGADAGYAGLAVREPQGELVGMESERYWSAGVWRERPRTWARGVGMPGWVLETEFPYFSNDYATDPLAEPDLPEVARAICVPIKNERAEVIGFFELHRGPSGSAFTWHDAAVLEQLGNMAALALENALLWRSLEATNRQLQAVSAANVERLESERQHIARELHDETGQALIGIKLGLQAVAGLVPPELVEVRQELDLLRQQVNEATTRIKQLARQLRPPTLDQCGLATALEQLVEEYRRRSGVVIELSLEDADVRLCSAWETAIYRIAQEALTNTIKHAQASVVRLRLRQEAGLVWFSVSDDGVGFEAKHAHNGLGLLGMRERVAVLGGEFELATRPGQGTTITVKARVNHHVSTCQCDPD